VVTFAVQFPALRCWDANSLQARGKAKFSISPRKFNDIRLLKHHSLWPTYVET